MHFLTKCQFHHLHRAALCWGEGTFFWKVTLHQFLKQKNRTLLNKCTGHFESSQFSPKSAVLKDLIEKFLKVTATKTYYVCCPNILLYMVLNRLWAKNAMIWSKTIIFHLKNYTFGFLRDLKVKLKFQDNFYNIIHHSKCPSSEKSADNVFWAIHISQFWIYIWLTVYI